MAGDRDEINRIIDGLFESSGIDDQIKSSMTAAYLKGWYDAEKAIYAKADAILKAGEEHGKT